MPTSSSPTVDNRNVIDYFKYWKNEAINAALDSRAHAFGAAMEHWESDLNIGGLIRNVNAFCGREFHYIGKRNWDRRGTVGTHHYIRMQHHKTIESFVSDVKAKGFTILCLEDTPDAKPLETYDLPLMSMFVFGNEALGTSEEMLDAADDVLYIKQYGSVRSLNASVASGIAMYQWVLQHGHNKE